ncbi:uncharacterized protein K452DRAFT_80108 [Aplosporella prunicola CBS 121167]|uniref:Uncharacterized protein n=1 Tax=Aplosporella prunicola CBS 121167 TaxID=1176127 RepID=A0A6A6B5B6_9PEZI|nr:uncharacterized protein K452DRAFT_80108 [Aplosporella prunicola CBS 121167]KAF2139046.1 hypothetical protein K452DRAFT_80108 [Aplosporella prunicola CBS 121167]
MEVVLLPRSRAAHGSGAWDETVSIELMVRCDGDARNRLRAPEAERCMAPFPARRALRGRCVIPRAWASEPPSRMPLQDRPGFDPLPRQRDESSVARPRHAASWALWALPQSVNHIYQRAEQCHLVAQGRRRRRGIRRPATARPGPAIYLPISSQPARPVPIPEPMLAWAFAFFFAPAESSPRSRSTGIPRRSEQKEPIASHRQSGRATCHVLVKRDVICDARRTARRTKACFAVRCPEVEGEEEIPTTTVPRELRLDRHPARALRP